MSYTAGELEAFDPPLASHFDSAEADPITPFPFTTQHDKHTQNKIISAGSFLTKSPIYQSSWQKPALKKG